MPEKIYVGDLESLVDNKKVEGKQLKIANENFYKISNVDKMRPFFMSIVSNSNHWMFISSTGSLSAGRKNSEFALFPYYTDDKITESSETTGSKTILIAKITGKKYLWEPFSNKYSGIYNISRNIYKNTIGSLNPTIMVRGEQIYLSNRHTANHIRALLLAGIRAVSLWKTQGGNTWQLLLNKKKTLECIKSLAN